jgi:hypothetical protein
MVSAANTIIDPVSQHPANMNNSISTPNFFPPTSAKTRKGTNGALDRDALVAT